MAWTRASLGLVAVIAVSALAIPSQAAGQPLSVPDSLIEPANRLASGLSRVQDSSSLDQARRVHELRVVPASANLTPYAVDLAGRDGELLGSYLDRLDTQLARGNLSNAQSLAGAAANLVEDEIAPTAARWDSNRTALGIGPLRWTGDRLVASLVLLHPPPASIGAFAAQASLTGATTPVAASLDVGQGDTRIDPGNGTVRWASFDASALARLDTATRSRVALGSVQLDATNLSTGDRVRTDVTVDELADANGKPLVAIGLSGSHEVPAAVSRGIGVPPGWLALGGVALAAVGLIALARRWEV